MVRGGWIEGYRLQAVGVLGDGRSQMGDWGFVNVKVNVNESGVTDPGQVGGVPTEIELISNGLWMDVTDWCH